VSRLFNLAARAGQLLARRGAAPDRPPDAGQATRGQTAGRLIGQLAAQAIASGGNRGRFVAAAGPTMIRLLAELGGLGDVIRRAIGAGRSSTLTDRQIGQATGILDELGGAVAQTIITTPETPDYSRGLGEGRRLAEEIEPQLEPDVQPPGRPPGKPPGTADDGWPEEHSVPTFGRGSIGYDEEGTRELVAREILTPGSSNVYSFVFEAETEQMGILYVTFKAWHPGQRGARPNSPGPTYAYYDVPTRRYRLFESSVDPSGKGAGVAVWDYLRVRGSQYDHRFPYRLVAGSIIPAGGKLVKNSGVYVPRKATRGGFKKRALPFHGTARRAFRLSTLPETNTINRGRPAGPNRGRPNNGRR
jgi:hypothetical protein